jgi:hypothetical protein
MFRTSCVHHQKDYTVHAVFMVRFSCWNYNKRLSNTIILFGSAAQRRLWPPRPRSFLITHDTPQSVGLLWTSDQLIAETSTWQHTTYTTNIHAPGGIRTYNRSRRAAIDLRLRPSCHWDRQATENILSTKCYIFKIWYSREWWKA